MYSIAGNENEKRLQQPKPPTTKQKLYLRDQQMGRQRHKNHAQNKNKNQIIDRSLKCK